MMEAARAGAATLPSAKHGAGNYFLTLPYSLKISMIVCASYMPPLTHLHAPCDAESCGFFSYKEG